MAGWILAAGRDAPQTLDDVTPAGAATIVLTGADIIFSPGDPLFISEADGTETQWLGRIVQLTPVSVSFSRPLKQSKNSGAKLWRARSAIAATEAAPPAKRTRHGGVVVERSLGGEFYAVRVSEPSETFTLELGGLTPAESGIVTAWLDAAASGGLEPIALIAPAGGLLCVRLSGEPIVRELDRAGRITLKLPFILVGEEIYP